MYTYTGKRLEIMKRAECDLYIFLIIINLSLYFNIPEVYDDVDVDVELLVVAQQGIPTHRKILQYLYILFC